MERKEKTATKQATSIDALDDHSVGPLQTAIDSFVANFGYSPTASAFAPGRVNLIGEHTDYNGGLCLPCAINLGTAVTLGVRPANQPDRLTSFKGMVRLRSTLSVDEMMFPMSPTLSEVQIGWSRYVAGVLYELQLRGAAAFELDVMVHSTVPVGSGLSSSAALEVATAKACCLLHGLEIDDLELACLCQRAEHQFAGVPCGLMDQMASIFGQPERLLLLDFGNESWTQIDFLENVALVVVNSGVSHSLAGSEYAARRSECVAAARQLGVKSLSAVESLTPDDERRLGSLLNRRVQHVVTENRRVRQFCAALMSGDLAQAGAALYASHDSLRSDYEVSCVELDALVEEARHIGVAGGVWGARMTGGGFGGCIVVLATRSAADSIADHFRKYLQRFGIGLPRVWVLRPTIGARASRV